MRAAAPWRRRHASTDWAAQARRACGLKNTRRSMARPRGTRRRLVLLRAGKPPDPGVRHRTGAARHQLALVPSASSTHTPCLARDMRCSGYALLTTSTTRGAGSGGRGKDRAASGAQGVRSLHVEHRTRRRTPPRPSEASLSRRAKRRRQPRSRYRSAGGLPASWSRRRARRALPPPRRRPARPARAAETPASAGCRAQTRRTRQSPRRPGRPGWPTRRRFPSRSRRCFDRPAARH